MKRQPIKASKNYSFLFPVGIGIGVSIGAAIRNIA